MYSTILLFYFDPIYPSRHSTNKHKNLLHDTMENVKPKKHGNIIYEINHKLFVLLSFVFVCTHIFLLKTIL